MSFGSIFSGERHYVLRQSSNHSSVVKISCTYLEKREREKKGGENVKSSLKPMFVHCFPFPSFSHSLYFSGKSLISISVLVLKITLIQWEDGAYLCARSPFSNSSHPALPFCPALHTFLSGCVFFSVLFRNNLH